ncbi:MAG: hypothetical protein J5879_01510 [Clostridia bacterium]|nr:hypothetical protein [Clostridia bacterium]
MTLNQRAEEEIAEFSDLYPDTDLDSVPGSVWEDVKQGKRLALAYGEYEENRQRSYEAARLANEENAAMSSGRISGAPKKAFYTASEVSAMSPKEVAENYDDILYSMKTSGFYS